MPSNFDLEHMKKLATGNPEEFEKVANELREKIITGGREEGSEEVLRQLQWVINGKILKGKPGLGAHFLIMPMMWEKFNELRSKLQLIRAYQQEIEMARGKFES